MAYNFEQFKKGLKAAEEWVAKEYSAIRAGRATPALLDGIMVSSYGTEMALTGVANMSVEDARTIRLSPWDMSQIGAIEKAISEANLGVSAIVDDKGVRVIFPELTSDRRISLIKVAKDKLEEGKIRIRQEREKTIKDLQAKEKASEMSKDEMERMKLEVEKLVKEANAKLDIHLEKKQAEISI